MIWAAWAKICWQTRVAKVILALNLSDFLELRFCKHVFHNFEICYHQSCPAPVHELTRMCRCRRVAGTLITTTHLLITDDVWASSPSHARICGIWFYLSRQGDRLMRCKYKNTLWCCVLPCSSGQRSSLEIRRNEIQCNRLLGFTMQDVPQWQSSRIHGSKKTDHACTLMQQKTIQQKHD